MASHFWENVHTRLGELGKTQKWLAEASGVGRTAINTGISRNSSPAADNAYAISRVLEQSVEELLDGKAGAEYVRKIVGNDPRAIQVPGRIFDIVEDLLLLDDKELSIIRATASAAAAEKKGVEAYSLGAVG